MRSADVRRLYVLLAALQEDSEIMAQFSAIQVEQIKGATDALRSVFAFVDDRDLEDSLNEG